MLIIRVVVVCVFVPPVAGGDAGTVPRDPPEHAERAARSITKQRLIWYASLPPGKTWVHYN